jgi:hypothetical protein
MTTYNLPNDNVLSVDDDGTQEFYIDQSTLLTILKKLYPRLNIFVFPWQNKLPVIFGRFCWFLKQDYRRTQFSIKFTIWPRGGYRIQITAGDELEVEIGLDKYSETVVTIKLSASMRGRYFDNIIRDVVGLPASNEIISAGIEI